jgi:mono/diheme cytochrome c family protein
VPTRTALAAIVLVGLVHLPLALAAERDGADFYRRDCARCHGPHGRGDGPDVGIFTSPPRDLRTDFLTKYSTAELVRRVRRGSVLKLDVDPKAFGERSRDVTALVAHLERLPDIDWRLVDSGLTKYSERCEKCHGHYGHPPAVPSANAKTPRDLSDPAFQRDTSDDALRVLVRHGREGMPPLTPAVKDADAAALAAYVRLLSPGYELYVRFCANCHGDNGRGAENLTATKTKPIVLDEAYFAAHDHEHVANAVWHMMGEKKPQMPHLRRNVSETAAQAIINFLKSLQD